MNAPFHDMKLDADVSEHREVIERVYREDPARLWRALLGFTGDADVASDAAAEAFAQALGRDGELRSPTGWIWTSAFKIAAGMMKRGPEHQLPRQPDVEIPEPVTDLVRILSRLSEHQRIAVVMHDYADRPMSEVAAALGITNATVYVHLSQGRRRLRAMLEDDDA